jgi:putative ATPase
MRELGYGKGYRYAHDDKDGIVAQSHLPEEIEGQRIYLPSGRGYESVIKERLQKWRAILRNKIKG